MGLTVSQVIALEVFQPADPKVVVGGRGMDRLVRWVHISDYLDIASSLRGGELLLTSGFRMGGDPAAQTQYADDLAAAQVAAVVLEAGKDFVRVPEPLVAACENNDLPLILLRTPTPYVDITENVHTALINSHYEALSAAQSIGEDLTRLLLNGARPRQIVQRLSSAVRNPVFVEDAAHHLVEYAAYGRGVDDLVSGWSGHSRGAHNEASAAEVSVGDGRQCAWAEIMVRNQQWGRVHVLDLDTNFDEMTRLILDRGSGTLAMSLLTERDATNWVEQAREELVDDIVHGSYVSDQELLNRMRQLGVQFEGGQVVALAAELYPEMGDHGASQRRDVSVLQACVRAALRVSKGTGIHAIRSGRVLLLAAAPRMSAIDASEYAMALGAGIIDRTQEALGDVAVLVGVSRGIEGLAFKQGIEQAELALKHRFMKEQSSGVSSFADLGFEQLFLELTEGPDLALLVERELGPLLSYDALNTAELTQTLRIVLASSSISAASETLHIERRTVYHRLEKIRSLIDCDLDDPSTRIKLTLALEAEHYLPSRRRRI
jgi:purine catabolism regulator